MGMTLPKPAKSEEQVVIDLYDSGKIKFSNEDLHSAINLHGEYPEDQDKYQGWRRVYPELFGHKLPNALKFLRFELWPVADLATDDQQWRVGGRSQKKTEISQNIERNGYKLKYPPISVFFYDDLRRKIITGNTRTDIVESAPFFMENVIIARFEKDPDASDEAVEDAIEECGGMFNSIHDPAATVSPEDVKRIVDLSIKRFNDTKGKHGTSCTISAIERKVDRICGEGVFQPATRLNLVYEIWNNFKPEEKVISWSNSNLKTEHKVSTFMQYDAKFQDTTTVKYMVTSSQTESPAFHKATALAAKYPKAEIRVVIHTGTLGGYNLGKTFRERTQRFVERWDVMLKNVCKAFIGKEGTPLQNNIEIYAVLPALGSEHNVHKPFFFNHKTTTCYQKPVDGGYSFDYTDPEGLLASSEEDLLEAA